MFPTKAIKLWRETDDVEHALLIGAFLHYSRARLVFLYILAMPTALSSARDTDGVCGFVFFKGVKTGAFPMVCGTVANRQPYAYKCRSFSLRQLLLLQKLIFRDSTLKSLLTVWWGME